MKADILRYKLTYILIFINMLVYLFSAFYSHDFMDMDMEVLIEMGALFSPLVIEHEQWWRLGTAMFLHGGLMHILMNMFSLYLIGRSVESYFNPKSYLAIYLFSGLIGAFFSLYMHPQSVGVGASGAIFGLFGALAGFFLAHREQIQSHTKAFMKDFGIILGINLVIGISIPSVDISAHIGGLIIGMIGGFILSKNLRFFTLYFSAMLLTSIAMATFLSSTYVPTLF